MAVMIITGCSARQQPGTDTPEFVFQHSDKTLTPQEEAALNSKGQIDKNIPEHAMRDVAREYKRYLGKNRSSVCAVTQRSAHHLNYAKQVFKSRGMPEELANLAIVESGYRANAVSSAGAAGAWQFMPGTGIKYGLVQDNWQDERLDPYRATEAAADYLQYLHNYFGDWPTAIAAYNAGEGKMARAKAGLDARDFFEVSMKNEQLDEKTKLRDETKNYVPRFLAVTKIMRNLPQLGFEPVNTSDIQQVYRLKAAPGTDLAALSNACALPWKDFSVYNQHHKRTITCTDKPTFVYVPNYAQKLAAQYLDNHQNGDFAGWKLVKVKKSSTLSRIGKQNNISIAMLQRANPGASRIKSGQVILVPGHFKMEPAPILANKKTKAVNEKLADSVASKARRHKIAANETLYAIAKKYKLDAKKLQEHNGIKNPANLRSGQILLIPAGNTDSKKAALKKSRPQNYTVKPKDNLWSISRKLQVSVEDLKRWNKIDGQHLKPGLTLAFYRD